MKASTAPGYIIRLLGRYWDICLFLAALGIGVGVVLCGVWQGSFDKLMKDGWKQRLIEGEWTAEFNQSLPYLSGFEWWAQKHREGAYLLAGSYGPTVREGCASWLFLQEEIQAPFTPRENMQERLGMVKTVAARLRQHDVDLVVLMVPDKSRIQQTELCDLPRPQRYQQRLSLWSRGLLASAIPVLDLSETYTHMQAQKQPPYWRLDSHWNQAGARQAAWQMQQFLEQKGKLPAVELSTTVHLESEQARQGDLIRYAGLEHLPADRLPAPDMQIPTVFDYRQLPAAAVSDDELEAALFGDQERAAVALVGTSFSRTADFESYLKEALAVPVINAAMDGGEMWKGMDSFIQQSEREDTWPVLLIWEIPERYIEKALDPKEQEWLAQLGRQSAVSK